MFQLTVPPRASALWLLTKSAHVLTTVMPDQLQLQPFNTSIHIQFSQTWGHPTSKMFPCYLECWCVELEQTFHVRSCCSAFCLSFFEGFRFLPPPIPWMAPLRMHPRSACQMKVDWFSKLCKHHKTCIKTFHWLTSLILHWSYIIFIFLMLHHLIVRIFLNVKELCPANFASWSHSCLELCDFLEVLPGARITIARGNDVLAQHLKENAKDRNEQMMKHHPGPSSHRLQWALPSSFHAEVSRRRTTKKTMTIKQVKKEYGTG